MERTQIDHKKWHDIREKQTKRQRFEIFRLVGIVLLITFVIFITGILLT